MESVRENFGGDKGEYDDVPPSNGARKYQTLRKKKLLFQTTSWL